jgi:hypothetical protein
MEALVKRVSRNSKGDQGGDSSFHSKTSLKKLASKKSDTGSFSTLQKVIFDGALDDCKPF